MNNANILVVDDDPDTCHLVSFMLERNQYNVHVAYGGEEGLEKLQSSDADIVVLDIMMPDIDGLETCRRMKATRNVPILFLSALTDIESVSQGFRYGGDDYICKPFRSVDLTSSIRNLLHSSTYRYDEMAIASIPQTEIISEATNNWISKQIYHRIKRLMDILIAGICLFLLSPLILLVAILIKIESPGPVIFKQERVRRKGTLSDSEHQLELETFTFYKFRTMYQESTPEIHEEYLKAFIQNDHDRMIEIQKNENTTRKLTADPRITKFGKFFRRSSIDEIPQFWNVLKGDMSIVGPRPPIPYEVEMYKHWHRKRLRAKPGITGLWQVTARSSAEFDEIVRMDNWYYENQSFWLDLKIVLKTPFSVFRMDGAI
jgi:lipopolysaccharide/colanic/teichoic acid biosynthesis glycosyltransferase